MTEFPELQHALVAAAGRRRRRAPRLARPLIVAVACAAIAVAVVLTIARDSSDERTAAPPPRTADMYAVFQRPATDADEPPSAVSGMPGLRIDEARLVHRGGPWRTYLVAGTLDGRNVMCAFVVVSDRSRFSCDPPGAVHGTGFPPGDGEPGGVVVTVPDGIDEIEIGFSGRAPLRAPVRDNVVLAPLNPWPAGPGTITWAGGEAALKSP
jgi:hypothetical protein